MNRDSNAENVSIPGEEAVVMGHTFPLLTVLPYYTSDTMNTTQSILDILQEALDVVDDAAFIDTTIDHTSMFGGTKDISATTTKVNESQMNHSSIATTATPTPSSSGSSATSLTSSIDRMIESNDFERLLMAVSYPVFANQEPSAEDIEDDENKEKSTD